MEHHVWKKTGDSVAAAGQFATLEFELQTLAIPKEFMFFFSCLQAEDSS